MKEEIETHYIFLDTSIFIKENFFAGNKLKAFLNHEKESEIELLTTEITIRECLSNLSKSLDDSNSTLKRVLRELSNKAKTFKNIDCLEELFNLNKSFEFKTEKNELIKKFEELKSNHFKIIDLDEKKITKIINDYFDFKPPFEEGKKKSEFPDAIVLNSLESWSRESGEKIYVVSDDGDMNSYKSDYLIPVKEYDKLLNSISFTFSKENISIKIDETLENNENEIIKRVEELFTYDFPDSGYDDSQGFEYDLNGITGFEGYIESHYVLQIDDNVAIVELTIPVEYEVDVSYEDTSIGWYDKEDDRWYGTETVNKIISDKTELKVTGEIEFQLPGKEIVWKDWDSIEISSGIPKDISIDH